MLLLGLLLAEYRPSPSLGPAAVLSERLPWSQPSPAWITGRPPKTLTRSGSLDRAHVATAPIGKCNVSIIAYFKGRVARSSKVNNINLSGNSHLGGHCGVTGRDLAVMPVFQAVGLCKRYQVGEVTVTALQEVDIELEEGEFVVMLGPSGSGKSTLLNLLGGLDLPSSGQLYYRGQPLTAMTQAALTRYRRDFVGFVFQSYNLIPSLTALENVALITELVSEPMAPLAALELVGLAGRQHHFPSQLSGGEQQRVAIARAIAKRPAVLLCDEPTGALDVGTGIQVLQALQQVNQQLGTTAVVITHNAVIAEMADRVIRLSDGRVQEISRPARRRSPDQLRW